MPVTLRRRLVVALAMLCTVSFVAQFHQFVQLHRLDDAPQHSPLINQSRDINLAAAAARKIEHAKQLSSTKNVHIVFSTDCSGYQHYQSIVSYYSIRRSGHLGPTTRIVSGCTPSQQVEITNEFERIDPTKSKLHAHFSPSFALKGKHYKYSNKPGGMYHWMNQTTIEESVIVLLDPDMMLLRPITPILGVDMSVVSEQESMNKLRDKKNKNQLVEYKDKNGRIQLLRLSNLPPLPPYITQGVAAGQHFGIGGLWSSSGKPDARKDFREFNLTRVCGPSSPCLNQPPQGITDTSIHYTTREEADKNYAVGPYGENSRSVCEGARFNRLPGETLRRLKNYGYGYQHDKIASSAVGAGPLPTTLHYCQRYEFANHTFAKRKIRHDFFPCDGTPMDFNEDAIMRELDLLDMSGLSESQKKVQRRMAYMICHLIPLMNLALEEYKVDMNC
eukprot:scaffold656_cov146-Skeletonema_menzelii.AAC.3